MTFVCPEFLSSAEDRHLAIEVVPVPTTSRLASMDDGHKCGCLSREKQALRLRNVKWLPGQMSQSVALLWDGVAVVMKRIARGA